MLRALLYLRLTSAKNWLLSRVRRLRQPKYLLGMMAGVAYFWFFFFRPMAIAQGGVRGLPGAMPPEIANLPLMFILVPLGLITLLRLITAWVAPSGKPGLPFTEAEVAFLFPAPMTRRMLVNYKLLSGQFTILFSALLFSLISNRGGALGGNLFTHAIGWWLMLSTLSLHSTGAAFTVTRLINGGVSKRQRQVVVTGVIVLFLTAVGYILWRSAPPPTDAQAANPWTLLQYATGLADHGLLFWAVLPFRIMLAPFLAPGWREFFSALWPALLLLAAHYIWVLRAETSFEEGSIAFAEKRAKMLAAIHAGNYRLGQGPAKARRGPFVLAPAGGRPEVAFLWKNLLATPAFFRPRTFLVGAVLIVAVTGWLGRHSESQRTTLMITSGIAAALAAYTLMLGPQFARQDLRSDLVNADLLKTYPLRGWQVVLGELLTPVAILTALLWLFILTAALASNGVPGRDRLLTPELCGTVAVCLALVVPLLCALQLMIPNGATLLFPSWTQTTRTRDRGIDVMGQRLIFVAGQILVIVLALIPAAAAGVLLWFAAHWVLSAAVSTAVATAGVLAVLGLELGLGLWWLGRRFEQFDLSIESVK